jgi:hypothetical protein
MMVRLETPKISIVEFKTMAEPAVGGSESAERGVFLNYPSPAYCDPIVGQAMFTLHGPTLLT